jgi:hypothetical protein
VQGLKEAAGASIMVEMLRSRRVKARKMVEAKRRKAKKGIPNSSSTQRFWRWKSETRGGAGFL